MLDTLPSILMVIAVIGLVFSRSMIRSLLWLSTFSLMLTVKYFNLNAPDVAITEAALGTGLSTLVFLTAIRRTRERASAVTSDAKPTGLPHD